MTDIDQVVTFTPLSTALQTVHQGKTKYLLEAVDDGIAEVVRALQSLGGSGKVTVELSFTRKDGRVDVDGIVKQKKPETGAIPSHFFIDKAGRLVQDDPLQERLPFVESIGGKDR